MLNITLSKHRDLNGNSYIAATNGIKHLSNAYLYDLSLPEKYNFALAASEAIKEFYPGYENGDWSITEISLPDLNSITYVAIDTINVDKL